MRPLNSPPNLRRRRWQRISYAVLAGFMLLLWLLPTVLTQLIRYQVPRLGLGQIEIGNIDLNLFRGKLLLEEVQLYQSAARVFSLQRAEIDLAMLSLPERRLHLQSLSLQGLSLTLQQAAGQPLRIAGILLPPRAVEEQPPDGETAGRWGYGIDSVTIRDSVIQVIHPHFSETMQLHSLSLGSWASWRPAYVTPVRLSMGLHDGQIDIRAESRPFAVEPAHEVELKVVSLPLQSLSLLASPLLSQSTGELALQMQIKLQQHATGALSLQQQGSLSLNALALQRGKRTLSQQGVKWRGKVISEDVTDIAALRISGDLQLAAARLLAEGEDEPLISWQGLSLSGLELQGDKQLSVAELSVEGMTASATRSSQGIALSGLADTEPNSTGQSGPVGGEQSKASVAEPFHFRIGQLRLSGENRLRFTDNSVAPPFRQGITLTEGELRHIDSRDPQQATTIMLKGKDEHYATFIVQGEGRLFAPQLAVNLRVKLSGYDMPPASPYLVQLLGYRITTGQLDSEAAIAIEGNMLKGQLDLHLSQLQLKQEDTERIAAFQQQSRLPLNTALSLLRDKNGNIRLKLPISGQLDDPQFDMHDMINTALAKTLKGASVSYLKMLLQPYGSLITVVQLAGKLTEQIQLDPILFDTGSEQLVAETAPYIDKIGQLLERRGIKLRLCGYATTADLRAITKGQEKTIPTAGHPQLEALAKQRADAIKSLLVTRYGVAPERLFVCHPELDRTTEAMARVELTI